MDALMAIGSEPETSPEVNPNVIPMDALMAIGGEPETSPGVNPNAIPMDALMAIGSEPETPPEVNPNTIPMDALMAIGSEPVVEEIETQVIGEVDSLSSIETETSAVPMYDEDAPKVSPGEFFGADEVPAEIYGSIAEKERVQHQQVVETRTSFVIGGTQRSVEENVEPETEVEPVSEEVEQPEPEKTQPKADYDAWDDAWKEPEPEPKPDRVVKSTDSLNVELEW
jgi:hypothetical protein